MKKTLTLLTMGACAMLALNSCQSFSGGGYYDTEEAVPMSEMTVADGEIPPWLLEDSGDIQVDAGATTHNPNTFPIPEPGESLEDSGSSAGTSQRQPELAANDVTIETDQQDVIVAPIETPSAPSTGQPAFVSNDTPQKPAAKPSKRVTEPTLVTYKVKPGDNLSAIARRSGTTIEEIREVSGITGDTIYAGTTIKVPYTPSGYRMSQGGKAGSYTVKRGDTLAKIAEAHGVSTSQLAQANNLSGSRASRIHVGQKLVIPGFGSEATTKATTYTVKRGDTMDKIAARHGVTTQQLLKANKMTAKQAGRIHAGRKLTIPGSAAAAAATRGTGYTVKRGDTLAKIAARHGVTTQQLISANGLTPRSASNLRAGQTLTIPAKAATATRSGKATVYTVKRGDTIAKIANAHGITVQELISANKLTAGKANSIHIGQRLTIPAKAKARRGRR